MPETEGRDLVAEAKQMTLAVMAEAALLEDGKGISLILGRLDPLVGGTNRVIAMLGLKVPGRARTAFEGVSAAMADLDPSGMEVCHSLALISITNSARERIPAWLGFVKRSYAYYLEVHPDRADALIEGYL